MNMTRNTSYKILEICLQAAKKQETTLQVVVHFSPFIQYSSDHNIEEYFIFISRVFVQLNKAKY